MASEHKLWDEFAHTYDAAIFHLTKYPRIRKKLLKSTMRGLILDLGCGPRGLLLNEMQSHGDIAIGLDISYEMLEKAKQFFRGQLICGDSKSLPFQNETCDSVVSVNSILPEQRSDVSVMFSEVYRVLKPNGRFVAYLPSYDYGTKVIESGMELKQDPVDFREWDTGGWQCFYTRSIIENLMKQYGYSEWEINIEIFDGQEELKDAKRIYDFDFSKIPIEEYFLVARK